MKNLSYCILAVTLISCNPKVSINSGKNDRVTEELVTGQGNDTFQVTYEETEKDRRLRYELLEDIRDYQAVMPKLDEQLDYRVTYKSPKEVSYFLNDDLECRYQYTAEVIKETIVEVDEDTLSYKIEKKVSPVIDSIVFLGEGDDLKNLCNIDIDQLNILNEVQVSLLDHILQMKTEAEQKLTQFGDMCRYGGLFKDGGACLGHRIQVEKMATKEMTVYSLNSLIEGETNRIEYRWQLSTSNPYFTTGFIYNLSGSTPDFETLDPHYFQGIEVISL